MRSCAIISVLALALLLFVACSTNDSNYASLCPNFQDQPTCPAPAEALCVGNNPTLGCALNALPSGLPCSGHAQCSMSVLPCPDEVRTWAGGGRVDAYICSCMGGRWSCDDCWLGEALCAEAPLFDATPAIDGNAMSVPDAAQVVDAGEAEVTDASFCQQSLDAWCASAQWPRCTSDWASALRNPASGQGCAGWSASACDSYNVLSQRSIDSGQDDYYDKLTGQLVAIVSTGNVLDCLGGPPDFVLPSACSPSMPLCNLRGDGGTDAPTEAVDSGGE